ncbi:twin-arginine translocase TatA/TatE family subunit [Desertihabitans brevis]|uniref:Sec-independent protein translocase protein TatA n=1 Tax=Desertihabitans brevis TaxID=2268447 RepID=A0A367Z2I3_9ACTN|nr:twin-arginine translocase TatA/TatE family subunit [Desertihabitans brevis]RCK71441.1 twin-arginine translocase TatA/TatE family subunit [Desertihabitans brevis]
MVFGLPGGPEVLILLVVALALLIFGGSRLAGIGKGTGRAIREFKEETQSLRGNKDKAAADEPADTTTPAAEPRDTTAPRRDDVVDAEVVDRPAEQRRDV